MNVYSCTDSIIYLDLCRCVFNNFRKHKEKSKKEVDINSIGVSAVLFKKIAYIFLYSAIILGLICYFGCTSFYSADKQSLWFDIGVWGVLSLIFCFGCFLLYVDGLLTKEEKEEIPIVPFGGVVVMLFLFLHILEKDNKARWLFFCLMVILVFYLKLLTFLLYN